MNRNMLAHVVVTVLALVAGAASWLYLDWPLWLAFVATVLAEPVLSYLSTYLV